MDLLVIFLRVIHIAGGIVWVGAVVTAVFFIEPAARRLGPTGDDFLAHLIARRRLTDVMALAALSAIGAGAVLYWRDSAGLTTSWIFAGPGLVYTIGALAAIVALLIGAVVLKPGYDSIAKRGGSAAHARYDDAILRNAGVIQVSLLILAVAAMATARYVR